MDVIRFGVGKDHSFRIAGSEGKGETSTGNIKRQTLIMVIVTTGRSEGDAHR